MAEHRSYSKGAPKAEKTYTIRELSDEFEVTARAIRFYESKDLIHPGRVAGQRVFSGRDRARLALILRGKRFGFSLNEIREMLDLYDLRDNQTEQYRFTLQRTRERIADLARQRDDIIETLAELEQNCAELERVLAARGIDPDDDEAISESRTDDANRLGRGPVVKSPGGLHQ